MTTKQIARDGGPAFPTPEQGLTEGIRQFPGMTLRDYFAAAALQGLLSNPNNSEHFKTYTAWAEWAFNYADAMLAHRDNATEKGRG